MLTFFRESITMLGPPGVEHVRGEVRGVEQSRADEGVDRSAKVDTVNAKDV